MPTCRSSGVLTANAVVNAGRCKLISIHATYTGTTAATTVKVFDNASAASGTELARLILRGPHAGDPAVPDANNLEFDMHGVLALNGLYLQISTGTGTGAAVSVEFA
tara:strand:- start:6835 stop:7155 length:321 start_codon:yes stop_codon:yes gene_type:complete